MILIVVKLVDVQLNQLLSITIYQTDHISLIGEIL